MTDKSSARSSLDPPLLDRAAGALVGLAAGDALGAGFEFKPPHHGDIEMVGGASFGWDIGEWTDDTQMAICIAEEAATGTLEADAVGERFLAWYREGQKDVGIQTSRVLGSAATGADLRRAAADHFAANPDNAAGNGSLMRTAPVALAHLGGDRAIVEAAIAVSSLTHGDPLAGEACAIWCIAIDRAIREGRLDGARDGIDLLDSGSQKKWNEWLDEAESHPPSSFTNNGFVVVALQAAHAAIHQTPVPSAMPCRHLQDALRSAVRIGYDTDTVAAIAGGLLGARWGATAVPMRWRRILHGWPGYNARDLVRLATLAVSNGVADEAGWPVADDLFPYYERMHPSRPIRSGLPDTPGIMLSNVKGARVSGADVVVSLCRMGARQFPHAEHHEVFLIDDPDPSINPNLDWILRDTADAICDWRDEGHGVLIHCVHAEMRTPTVAAAYLRRRFGLSVDDALDRVRQVFEIREPHPAFREALERIH